MARAIFWIVSHLGFITGGVMLLSPYRHGYDAMASGAGCGAGGEVSP